MFLWENRQIPVMKDNRFKLTAFLTLALLAVGVGLGTASQRMKHRGGESSRAGGPYAEKDVANIDIDRFLASIVQRWQQQDGLTADVVWQIEMFGQTIRGTGEYTQSGQGYRQRHGLVLQGEDPKSPILLQQAVLASSPVLWTQWKTSIDESASTIRLSELTSANPQMPQAGLAHLLWRLQTAYDFDHAERIMVEDREFLVVRGTKKGGLQPDSNVLPFLDANANGISLWFDASTGFPHRMKWESIEKDRRAAVVTVSLQRVRGTVSANTALLQPKKFVPDAKDQTEAYRLAVLPGAGGAY